MIVLMNCYFVTWGVGGVKDIKKTREKVNGKGEEGLKV
jgi:hypothetical protein